MTKRGNVGVSVLLLVPLAAAGCASSKLTFEKPGVSAADLKRDQSACVCTSLVTESESILAPNIDRDALIQCMQSRGYTVRSE